jgi:hypothetical protein
MPLSTQERRSSIERIVQRLYGNERLTADLTDEPAKALLQWAEQQILHMADMKLDEGELQKRAHQIERVVRAIDQLVAERQTASDLAMVERGLKVAERAMEVAPEALPTTSTPAPGKTEEARPQGDENDKTQRFWFR